MILDFRLMLFLAPALLLGLWAQYRVKSNFARASQIPARLSGAAAARHILDQAGLQQVDIEQVPGQLSDHYDPQAKVLRLSPDVYSGRNLAAVGIAAHEAGHAVQDAQHYAALVVRNAAVPMAGIGSNIGLLLMALGFGMPKLMLVGMILFSAVVIFQLVNLPVEYDASARAKKLLVDRGIVSTEEMPYVRRVLSAAALTYVAATLQSVLTLLYYASHFSGSRDES